MRPILYIGRAYCYRPDVALYIYIYFSTNISTEYFKHAAHCPFFSSKCRLFHNATFFGSCIIHILDSLSELRRSLCVKDDWKGQFWGLRYCLLKTAHFTQFFCQVGLHTVKIAEFNWECSLRRVDWPIFANVLTHWGRSGSFKLFIRPVPGGFF